MIAKLLSSLQVRITLLVIALVLGSLWGFAAVVANWQESRLKQVLTSEQAASLSYVAESLDSVIRMRLDAMERIAPTIALGQLDDPAALTDMLRKRPIFIGLFNSGIIVAKPDGAGAFADYPPLPGRTRANFSNLDSFQRALTEGRAVMGKPFRGRFIDKPVVTFAVPLKKDDGGVAAVLIGITTLDAPNFLDIVGMRRVSGGGDLVVVAPHDGIFVTGTDPSLMLKPLPAAVREKVLVRAKERFEGSVVSDQLDGIERLMSVRRIPTAGWLVLARLPTVEAFAPVRESRRLMFAGAALLSLLVGGAAALFLRRSLGPLAQASRRLDAAVSQDLTDLSPLPVSRQDEVGRLIDSFNRLRERLAAESDALRESEAHLSRAQTVGHIGSWHLDVGRDGFRLSPETYRILGLAPGTPLTYDGFRGRIHPDDAGRVDEALHGTLDGLPCEIEYRIVIDGDITWIHEHTELEYHGQKQPQRGIGTLRDISERKQAEDDLRLSASVFDNTHEGITITDTEGNILDVNPAFCEITGYSREEALGRNPRVLVKSGRHGPEFYEAMWQAILNRGYWRGDIWNRRKDGEVYAALLTISAVGDEQGQPTNFVGVFSDITQLKLHQRQLERMAHFDALTGIPNRVLLGDRMQQAMAQTQRSGALMAVCYLDLDNFKPINDTLGHEAGDRLLVETARRLKDCLRGGDTVARLGGDEFALLLCGLAHVGECDAVLERVVAAVGAPCEIAGNVVQVSPSIGVTLYPLDDADADALLRHADQAMYQAKQEGRNRYRLFDAEHDRRTRAHLEAVGRIEEAMAAREFVLHYQPRVDMRRGHVVGAEALIRWRHPERGLLSPAEFLPAIENSDLIVAVGEWVIESALAQMAAWRRNGLDIAVSVNIAARHLQRGDFVSRLETMLAAHGGAAATAGRLELEVLETAALEDMAQVSEVIETCRDLGITFAIDDFGTGYSSLTYFKALPAHTLKIDQSFIRDMLRDPDDLAIVEGVIGLTEIFRRQVVAEGVESVEHGIALLGLGCDLAQGYGIARPMPPEALEDWARDWRPDPSWARVGKVRWPREDLQLLVAENNHRQWVDHVVACVEGANPIEEEPLAGSHDCRFGLWFDTAGRARYGSLPEFAAIEPLHERIHAVGAEAVALREQGRQEEARLLLQELFALREALVARLHAMQSIVSAKD